jgi:hypothetical protein
MSPVIVEKNGARFLFGEDDFRIPRFGYRIVGTPTIIGRNEIVFEGSRYHVYPDRTLRYEGEEEKTP